MTQTECWIWPNGKISSGYGELRLKKGDKPVYAHRISAALFLGYRGEKNVFVLHKCDVKSCFNPQHLYLGSRKDNARDAVQRGQHLTGERCPWAKLSAADVKLIREMASQGWPQKELACVFGVNQPTISRTINGVQWKSI